jgi:predicted DCC family thiol-disulfide oxidoreductase YuxK
MTSSNPLPIKKTVILFDGVCNLCNGFVNLLLTIDKKEYFLFGSLQSVEAQKLLYQNVQAPTSQELLQSIVYLDEKNNVYRESQAIFQIAIRLGFPYRLLNVFSIFPVAWTNILYRWVAKNRYRFFGERSLCRLPTAEEKKRFI